MGCTGNADTPTSPSSAPGGLALTAEQLTGTWTLASIQPAGRPAQARPSDAEYTVMFAEGRLAARADCNVCAGPFTLSDQTLTAGPVLACTRAACRTMAFENEFTSLLAGDTTASLSGSTLVLSSTRGVLRFTR